MARGRTTAVLIPRNAGLIDDCRAPVAHEHTTHMSDRVSRLFGVTALGTLDGTLLAIEARSRNVHNDIGHDGHVAVRANGEISSSWGITQYGVSRASSRGRAGVVRSHR